MLRGALRRLLVLLVVVVGGTAALAAALGALAGKNVDHSLAIGYYVVGAAALVGSFVLGSRGPLRRDVGTDDEESDPARAMRLPSPLGMGPVRRRGVRKATPEERWESKRASVGLFLLGMLLVLIGALVDPSRRFF